MLKLEIHPEWALKNADGSEQRLRQLFDLLAAVASEGNLKRACARLSISYRHAWGLVRLGAQRIGAPLVNSGRGQHARLTPLGEKLVWANKRIDARLTPVLDSFASELESELKAAIRDFKAYVRIHASHAFSIAALRALMQEKRKSFDLRYVGGSEALAALARGACDMAGFHVPLGEFEPEMLQGYARWLDPRDHVLVRVVARRHGLIVPSGNPLRLAAIADLARPGLRFVNREPGSGTRMLLDLLLRKAGLDGSRIAGFDSTEYTHSAVAAYIASGMADAGLGIETAARQFRLSFVPLVNERYFLACRRATLASGPVRELLAVMQGAEFKARLTEIPGLDGLGCGEILPTAEVFPALLQAQAAPAREERRASAGTV